VGLAPAAAALLAARSRFNGAVLGPLSDHISTDRDSAELAERLLGEWMHAVLVRDQEAVEAIRQWHSEVQPGALVLLPADSGPQGAINGRSPLEAQLRAEGPAARWVQALLGGSEVLDQRGNALRRASGAVILAAVAGTSGPLRRRAEIGELATEIAQQESAAAEVAAALMATEIRLGEAERAALEALAGLERAREQERSTAAAREDAARVVQNLTRELTEAETGLARIRERLSRAEERKIEVDRSLAEGAEAQVREEAALTGHRAQLAAVEAEQEAARENRVHWQVQEAHVGARLRATADRLDRAAQTIAAAEEAARALLGEIAQLDQESSALTAQRSEWLERRRERAAALQGLEGASAEAEAALAAAAAGLAETDRSVLELRADLDRSSDEDHRLEVELTEVAGQRRSIVERVEAEWKQPFEQLLDSALLLDLDRETLETEAARIVESLDAIGVVNPLAVEEHAEESKRLEFLTTQRDDLVAARSSLLQAIREIDGTARLMFQETFTAVQDNFKHVFQTLFGAANASSSSPIPTIRSRARSTSTQRRAANGPSGSTCSPR
jgi:chromosome segregation protein